MCFKEATMLTCADITTLLKSILLRRDITEYEILRQLDIRHKNLKYREVVHVKEK